jgi:2-haloacid dehalogenase
LFPTKSRLIKNRRRMIYDLVPQPDPDTANSQPQDTYNDGHLVSAHRTPEGAGEEHVHAFKRMSGIAVKMPGLGLADYEPGCYGNSEDWMRFKMNVGNASKGSPLELAEVRGAHVHPKLLSFDVFGTLVSVRDSSYAAFHSILRDCKRPDTDVRVFWEYWEERNIAHYWETYRGYKEICELSLAEAFEHFGIEGDPKLIHRYFDAFGTFELYPDVSPTLDALARQHRLAIVSNIDDDLLAATALHREFDLVCTAERARGYKPDGTLFRYLIEQAGVRLDEILHAGQSQFTDMVGGKPLELKIAWINRRGIDLHPSVPRPDFAFRDIASLIPLLDRTSTEQAKPTGDYR